MHLLESRALRTMQYWTNIQVIRNRIYPQSSSKLYTFTKEFMSGFILAPLLCYIACL